MTKLFIGASIVGIVFLLGASQAYAQDSTLEQRIRQLDCAQHGVCLMDPPEITNVTINGGRPIVSGSYDRVGTEHLRVMFAGRTYVLGVDAELTVSNGSWRLDLSGLARPLSPGTYQLVVETEDSEDTLLRDTMMVRITQGNGTASGRSGGTLSDTGENIVLFVSSGILLIMAATVLLVLARRTISP